MATSRREPVFGPGKENHQRQDAVRGKIGS